MDDQSHGGWPADIVRASLVWLFYVGGVLFTFATAWGGLGWIGLFLWILTVIFGPFAAAWVACRIVPADRPLIATLGWGITLGLVFFAFLGFVVLKIAEQRHAKGGYISVVLVVGGPLLVALMFSRLKRWSSD